MPKQFVHWRKRCGENWQNCNLTIMKITKFMILFCLLCSTIFITFAFWVERDWLNSQKNALAVSSTPTAVDEVKQRFRSLDEETKLKFFDDFLKNLSNRDKSISNSINSSFEMTKTVSYTVFAFNALAAICVIYLLWKTRPSDGRK